MKKILPLLLFLMATSAIFLIPSPVYAAGSMYLDPAAKKVKVGEVFTVKIMFDSVSGQAVGGAAVINYDANLLEVQDGDNTKSGVQLLNGTAFVKDPVQNLVDPTTGKITLDYGNLQSPVSGVAELGGITFKAKNTGSAQVHFVFDPSSTTGSSTLFGPGSNNNLLTSVTDGNYAVSSSTPALGAPGDETATASSTTTDETSSDTETATESSQELPVTGFIELTLFMLGLAGIFLMGGFGVLRASR